MKTLTHNEIASVLNKVVEDFGNGVVLEGKYIFEQMIRMPPNVPYCRMKVTEAIQYIGLNEVLVVLDPHPNTRRFAEEVSKHLGSPGSLGFALKASQLFDVLQFSHCDMYVTARSGRLLICGCYHDDVVDGERVVWVPIWDAAAV